MDENETTQSPESAQSPASEQSGESRKPSKQAESDWQRRKRLAAVFGDVLPETTGDERGERSGTSDEWYRSQRPPHHGG